ncbi:hypothetical protein ACFLSX_05615, partial [Calditrichota bacterium]
VFDQALDAAKEAGAEFVSIFNVAAYYDIMPMPDIRFYGDPMSLNDDQLTIFVNLAHGKGLQFCLQEQVAAYDFLTPADEMDSIWIPHTVEWWNKWFSDYKLYLLDQVKLADSIGIEIVQLMQFAEFTFKDEYPQYDQKWREIIQEVKMHFSGKIGLSTYIGPLFTGKLTFLDELDIYIPSIATLGGGFPISGLSNPYNPSLTELTVKFNEYFDLLENIVTEQDTIYIQFTVASWDGQNNFEFLEPPVPSQRDFQEQVDYYEAFFQTIMNRTFIKGVFVERMAWFERLIPSPGYEYFDQRSSTSMRNKPAEIALKLWFETYK